MDAAQITEGKGMASKITMTELNRMDYEAIAAYEHKLGFIAPVYSAIVHADSLREDIARKSVAPDATLKAWKASWTFDNKRQLEYFRMVSKARGWFMYDLPASEFGPRLESRLGPIA